MQMQQQARQQEAQQELQRQHYGAMQQKQAESLQQQISADTWRQTHAEAQDRHLLEQEKVAEKRLKQQLAMEQDKEGVQLYLSELQMGKPYASAVRHLSPARRASLIAQHQEDLMQGLPIAQSLVEGVYNNPEAGRGELDPNAMAMIALTNAGLRPMDYMDKIDYSGMNPYPGYVPTDMTKPKQRVGQKIASAVKGGPSSIWGLFDRGMYNTSQFLHDVLPGATSFDPTYDENKAQQNTPMPREILEGITRGINEDFAQRHPSMQPQMTREQAEALLRSMQTLPKAGPAGKLPSDIGVRIFGDRPIPLHW